MEPIATRTEALPPSSELTADEMLKILAEIVPGALSQDHLLFDGTGRGELYFPTSWIYSLNKFARRRYHDDQLHENRMPRQLPTEEAWVHTCRALGCNWRDGVQAETPREEVAVIYDAIRAREGDVFEDEWA